VATAEEALAIAVPAFVGVVSLAIAAASFRALQKTGNTRIGFVVAGFLLLALKSFTKAWHLSSGPESLVWELSLSALDLASVLLIAWPLLTTWGRRIA
jgi:hypothetical protein